MAEQRTKVGPAYYDGWQKQVADLRAENERMRKVLENALDDLEFLHDAEMDDDCPGCEVCEETLPNMRAALGRPECGETETEQPPSATGGNDKGDDHGT